MSIRAGLTALSIALALTAAAGLPDRANAQADSTHALHATLQGWNEQMWLTIFDRGGSVFGRTSESGILQRFNPQMDSEYHIDVISYGYSMSEVYEWYRRENGARLAAGSIDHLRMIQEADFKAAVRLADTWTADVWFRYASTLEVDRSLVTLQFRHQMFDRRAEVFARGTVLPIKPEADLELGFRWMGAAGTITVAVGALDLFSDFIYQELDVPGDIADTTLNYTTHPFTGRVAIDVRLGRNVRAEGYALALMPTRLIAESQSSPGSGFEQSERYAYTGGLLEWTPSRRSALGGFGTWVGSRLDRTRLPDGRPDSDFDLSERTWRLGLYALHRFSNRFELESWIARVWRTEERTRPDTTVTPGVDYEDRSWASRNTLSYRARSGFRADFGLDFLASDVARPDDVPGAAGLGKDHGRIRLGLGWHFDTRAFFLLGANLDLDNVGGRGREDGGSNVFDGAYGRLSLYW